MKYYIMVLEQCVYLDETSRQSHQQRGLQINKNIFCRDTNSNSTWREKHADNDEV